MDLGSGVVTAGY